MRDKQAGVGEIGLYEPLPKLCAVCGEPAAVVKYVTFHRQARAFSRENQFESALHARLGMPVCARHRWHFLRQTVYWICAGCIVTVLPFALRLTWQPLQTVLLVVEGAAVLGFVMVAAKPAIKARSIKDGRVTLEGLSPKFIAALDKTRSKPTLDYLDRLQGGA
jgi:hypothetical protein